MISKNIVKIPLLWVITCFFSIHCFAGQKNDGERKELADTGKSSSRAPKKAIADTTVKPLPPSTVSSALTPLPPYGMVPLNPAFIKLAADTVPINPH